MKIGSVSHKNFTLFPAIFLVFVLLIDGFAVSTEAAETKDKKRSKIVITSNRMNAVSKKKYVEFVGNAKARQEDFVLTSDVLRIYYTESSKTTKKGTTPVKKGSISKIVAKGNVRITSEDFVAVSDIALYLTESMVLILKGPNSKITSGENSIVGSKITYYRSDGRVKIEGTSDKRVQAVFYSRKDESGKILIRPSSDDEDPLPSGSSKPLEEKEIAE